MNTRVVAIAVGALVVVAGCGSGSSGGSSTGLGGPTKTPKPHTGAPTPSVTSTAPTPTPTPTATVTTTPVTPVSRCLSSHLTLSLGQGQGAAGTTYTPIVLTNTGSTACELTGYPGVSFVTSSGHQVGADASRDPGTVKSIKLAANGGTASANLRQPNPGNFDPSACQQTTAAKLKVYPPGETVALTVSDAAAVCTTGAGRTGIAPVVAGSGG